VFWCLPISFSFSRLNRGAIFGRVGVYLRAVWAAAVRLGVGDALESAGDVFYGAVMVALPWSREPAPARALGRLVSIRASSCAATRVGAPRAVSRGAGVGQESLSELHASTAAATHGGRCGGHPRYTVCDALAWGWGHTGAARSGSRREPSSSLMVEVCFMFFSHDELEKGIEHGEQGKQRSQVSAHIEM